MTTNWDAVVKQARECHTKHAWETFFAEYGEAVAASSNSKPIDDIFKTLRADPQSLHYSANIWGQLVAGCLASWNLELGREIVEFAKKVASPLVNIPAAQLQLESGFPALARDLAHRSLRLTGLQPADKLQLEMLVARSYAEEGKRQKAIRLLSQMRALVKTSALSAKERADSLTNMARIQFFLGRYSAAGELFYEASQLYRTLEDWEAAAKTLFNTAACHLNTGTKQRDEAFTMIEECRRLAEAENLPGPLAHCEAAYGMDAYYRGHFAAAREHLRRGLECLPISDKSYRRLHILSMLALTYLAMGRYHLARKFGRQTLDLAALDESERNRVRYTALQAELLWEDGLIDESQALLAKETAAFTTRGVHTLEELAILSRYQLQSALLGRGSPAARHDINEALKKNPHVWLDYQFSLGQLALNSDDYVAAERYFTECLSKGRQLADRFHEAVGLLGLIESLLRQRRAGDLAALLRDFEVVVARLGETPMRAHALFVHAARAYQQGDFEGCVRVLRQAVKGTRQSFADKFVLSGCVATIEGRSSRLTADWQSDMLARFTRTYFAPTLEAEGERHFRVSGHYLVSLERHPSLAELLHFLLQKTNFSASSADIQSQVWKQSLLTQGWQQKIRNSIMRLRDFFPYTIAPLIMHSDNISLFRAAITIVPPRQAGLAPEAEIVQLLSGNAMSSTDLAHRLRLSPATTKRILKRLTDDSQVHATKEGRNVYYTSAAKSGTPVSEQPG